MTRHAPIVMADSKVWGEAGHLGTGGGVSASPQCALGMRSDIHQRTRVALTPSFQIAVWFRSG